MHIKFPAQGREKERERQREKKKEHHGRLVVQACYFRHIPQNTDVFGK